MPRRKRKRYGWAVCDKTGKPLMLRPHGPDRPEVEAIFSMEEIAISVQDRQEGEIIIKLELAPGQKVAW